MVLSGSSVTILFNASNVSEKNEVSYSNSAASQMAGSLSLPSIHAYVWMYVCISNIYIYIYITSSISTTQAIDKNGRYLMNTFLTKCVHYS